MGWKIYGRRIESGELSDTSKFQTVKINKNTILKAVRTWIIINNDPTFTDLNMKIYSNNVISGENSPGSLLYTSTNVQAKADILTENNGARELWFEFDDVPMQENTYYNFVLNGTGYAYSLSSHLAWRVAWPDPVHDGYTPDALNAGIAPYCIYMVGSEY